MKRTKWCSSVAQWVKGHCRVFWWTRERYGDRHTHVSVSCSSLCCCPCAAHCFGNSLQSACVWTLLRTRHGYWSLSVITNLGETMLQHWSNVNKSTSAENRMTTYGRSECGMTKPVLEARWGFYNRNADIRRTRPLPRSDRQKQTIVIGWDWTCSI